MAEECAQCRFWKSHPQQEYHPYGYCRVLSPRLFMREDQNESGWPTTAPDDWCGEWRPELKRPRFDDGG